MRGSLRSIDRISTRPFTRRRRRKRKKKKSRRERGREKERVRALRALVNFKGWPLFVVVAASAARLSLFFSFSLSPFHPTLSFSLALTSPMCLRDRYFYRVSKLTVEISQAFAPIDRASHVATSSCFSRLSTDTNRLSPKTSEVCDSLLRSHDSHWE